MADENAKISMVTVHESWGENDAELIRSMLAASGVESFLSGFPQSVYPMTVDGLGRIEIKVASENAERAVKLIDADSARS